jgi:tetratricopeptide (TPR) repeat protein
VGQLIDARSDKHLWAETYDRDLTDIFEVQSDVAKQIAMALEAEFSSEEQKRIEKKPTSDLTAYNYYLRGRDYYSRFTREDNERAIELFEKALEIDSNYALAHAGIAMGYAQRANRFGFVPAWVDSARVMANRALGIDPDLAEAHVALGNAYLGSDEFSNALEAYHRAIEVNPNHADAAANIGLTYAYLRERAKALRWYKRSVALDPMRATTVVNMAWIYREIGAYAEAEQWCKRALQIAPDYLRAEFELSRTTLMRGNGRQALDQIRAALSKDPDSVMGLLTAGYVALFAGEDALAREYYEELIALAPESGHARAANMRLAYLLWKAGERDEATTKLSEYLTSLEDEIKSGRDYLWVRYDVAAIHAVRGDESTALEWLQKTIDSGYIDVRQLSMDPLFDNLHEDKRFKDVVTHLETEVTEIRQEIEMME